MNFQDLSKDKLKNSIDKFNQQHGYKKTIEYFENDIIQLNAI